MDFTAFSSMAMIFLSGISALGQQVSDALAVKTVTYIPPVSSSYTLDLSDTEKNEVLSISLDGADGAHLANQLGYNYLHSGVVGLFGCPVEATAEEFDGAKLTFRCDPDNMRYVPFDNLIVLGFVEDAQTYVEIPCERDSEEYAITAGLNRGSVYMLADGYEWYSVWGEDTSRFEVHPTLLTNSDYTPEFSLVLPEFISLSQTAKDQGQDMEGFDYAQFAGTKWGSNPSFTATYMMGEDIWQYQCDSFCEAMHRDDRFYEYSISDFARKDDAQVKLYTIYYDESSRGGAVGATVLLHVKVSDDKLLSFSYGVTETDGVDVRQTVETCIEYFTSFRWEDEPLPEAFIPAEPWDISEHPEVQEGKPPVALEWYSYSYENLPDFTMLLPDCVTPNPSPSSYAWENESGITTQMLMYCNGSDDIYYDFELYSGADMWERRLEYDKDIFNIAGESHTVEDISAYTGCDSEIYVLRFADTGGVESSHRQIYVFGFYKLSETEVVAIRCDLWADVEEEYLDVIVLESMKSFSFTE